VQISCPVESQPGEFFNGPQIYAWKKQLLEHAVRAFDSGIGVEADERARREQAELYAKIGQLTVEKDFLSRRSGR
jgi:transposase